MRRWLLAAGVMAAMIAVVEHGEGGGLPHSLTESEMWQVRGANGLCVGVADDCTPEHDRNCEEWQNSIECGYLGREDLDFGEGEINWYACYAQANHTCAIESSEVCYRIMNCTWASATEDPEDEGCVQRPLSMSSAISAEYSASTSTHIFGNPCP